MGALNIAGLVLSFFGVLLLFRYGMPRRLPYPGDLVASRPEPGDEQDLAKHKRLSWTGLACIFLGTVLQVYVAAYSQPFWSWQ